MMETFYGTASPVWTASPVTGFALQTPLAIGNRAISAPNAFPANVYGAGMPSMTTPYGVPASSAAATLPYTSYPTATLASPETISGVTAVSLLAAVAMRRGQPQGPTNDQEVEDFLYEALDLLGGTADVEIRCEGGRTVLTGTVPHKRVKRDIGEIAWAIPAINDVQNNVTIASRRRTRTANRDGEHQPNVSARKQS
jgi:hypothetical protein